MVGPVAQLAGDWLAAAERVCAAAERLSPETGPIAVIVHESEAEEREES